MKTLDMCGQPCPIPMIEAKKAMAEPGADSVTVLVDNFVAVQNIQKMAAGLGYHFTYQQQEDTNYLVIITAEDTPLENASSDPAPMGAVAPTMSVSAASGSTILITCDQMGRGNEELGKILIKGFIFSLTQLTVKPEAVLFLNAGVNLVVEGAVTLEDLQSLTAAGTKISACGTCLNFYGLTEKLAVGEIVNMYDISEKLNNAVRPIIL